MLKQDFPHDWPLFLDSLNQILNTDDPNLLFTAMQMLKELVSCYRWTGTDSKGPLHLVISTSFQIILQKANAILHSNDVLAGSICHYICKIYHNSIEVSLFTITHHQLNTSYSMSFLIHSKRTNL